MVNNLEKIISSLNVAPIPLKRKEVLDELALFIIKKLNKNESVNLNFICTHNSRRSILSQVWGQTFVSYFQLDNIKCYSGGTEATVIPSMILEVLKSFGFSVFTISQKIFAVKYDKNTHPIIIFSKIYYNAFNPKDNFVAIMTCSDADAACPVVIGATKRIFLPYSDPKQFDKSELVFEKYKETSMQIANELFYLFQQIYYGLK